jgi:hypothetical protein
MRDLLSDTRYRTPGFHSEDHDFHAKPVIRGRSGGLGPSGMATMPPAGDAVACEASGKHASGAATVQVTVPLAVADRVMPLIIVSSR